MQLHKNQYGRLMLSLVLILALNLNNIAAGGLSRGIESISKVAIGMASAGSLPSAQTGIKFKLASAKKKAMAIDEDKTEAVMGAIEGVGEGLTKLVSGIQTGAWQDIIIGGLDIISSLTALADPKLAALTSILSIVSMVFGLFGGSSGGEESTEGMIKRVVEKALTEAQADNLRAQVTGVKRVYGSLSNSIKSFRESRNVSDDQATEFYMHAFTGVQFFGQLEFYINKWCEIGDASTYKAEKAEKLKDSTTRCLEFCNLYADLSILRQLLLADLSALLSELGQEAASTNLLKLLTGEQKADRNLFKFFSDPINYKSQRYVDAYFYSALFKYPTLNAYLLKLDKDEMKETNVKYLKPSVMVCSDELLKGDCYSYSERNSKSNLGAWNDAISSVYISAGRQVTATKHSRFTGAQYGPYYGPAVLGTLPDDNEWTSLTIERTTKDASKMLTICDAENLDLSSECGILDYGDYEDLKTPNKDKQGKPSGVNWSLRIESIAIPSGMKVTAFQDTGFKGKQSGPYYGPNTFNKLCFGNKWKSVKVERTTNSTSLMVQICQGENLSGFCDFVATPTEINTEEKMNSLKNYNGCDWDVEKFKIKSIKVPGGMKVEVFSSGNLRGRVYGPYTGPATVANIDGSTKVNERVRSFSIRKLF